MQQEITIRTAPFGKTQTAYGKPFYLTLIYLALEYGRPQESIPGFGSLHLPMIVVIFLVFSLIGSGKLNLNDMQTKLFLAFLGLMGAHIPFAVNNYWAFEMTRQMLITFIVYLAIMTFVDSFEKFQTLIKVWLIIHLYLAITGIVKGGKGVGGWIGDENDFALALNMVLPFGFFLAIEAKTQIKRILFLVVAGVFLICNVLTLSRGGFLGLVAVGVYCWFKSPRKVLSSLVVVLLIFVLTFFASDKYWERIQSIQDETKEGSVGSGQDRIYSWKAGWRMFLDHPILGVGPGNFPWNFEKYEVGEGFDGRLHGGRAAHSLYFTLFPELGLTGVILFILMLNADRKSRKELLLLEGTQKMPILKKPDRAEAENERSSDELMKAHYFSLALGGSLIGFFVSGTFVSVLYYPCFWVLIAFTMALKKVVQKDVLNLGLNDRIDPLLARRTF